MAGATPGEAASFHPVGADHGYCIHRSQFDKNIFLSVSPLGSSLQQEFRESCRP